MLLAAYILFLLLSESRDNVKDYMIELIDNKTWGFSSGLADAWRGVNKRRIMYVPSNNNDLYLDETEPEPFLQA